MSQYFLMLFILMFSISAIAQESDTLNHVNTIFEIRLDSIERKVTVYKWGVDSSYYLHYIVKNISPDTLTYITNSCFYYNHYSLKIGKLEFDINPNGGCLFNSMKSYLLPPGELFIESEWIIANNLNALKKGELAAKLSVPLVKHSETIYRVDGREFVIDEEYLEFNGQTIITETNIDNRKRKKNRS